MCVCVWNIASVSYILSYVVLRHRTNFFTVWYEFYDVIQIVLLLNILRFFTAV